MRKQIAAGVAILAALGTGVAMKSLQPKQAKGLEPRRGAAHLAGPHGGQHGPVRVRVARQARHRHDHRELDPQGGSGERAELLQVLGHRALPHQHRHRRGRGRRHVVPVPLHVAHPAAVVPVRDRLVSLDRRPGSQPVPDLHDHEGHGRGPQEASEVIAKDLLVPPANVGPRSTPNYEQIARAGRPAARGRRQGLRRPARTTRSTSTSAASSTSPPSARASARRAAAWTA